MVADWFVGREIVTAMSIFISSWPLGIGLGLVAYAPLAAAYGWGAVMHVAAAVALGSLALIAMLYRDPPAVRPSAPSQLKLDLTSREWLLVSLAGAV